MSLPFIFAVATGGAIGSVARYIVAILTARAFGASFPYGTLIINVSGSFLIGVFIALFATRVDLHQAFRIFLTVGFCGGYTTFSTFSLDVFYLAERGERLPAMAYVAASTLLSVAALFGAIHLVRSLQT